MSSSILSTLADAERDAIQALEIELRQHLELAEQTFNVAGFVASAAPSVAIQHVTQSRKVVTALLVRLTNDLRCTGLLVARGYPVQATSIVASMYEVAYTIASIGSDDDLAQSWIDHDDPTRTFRGVKELIQTGLSKLGAPNIDAQTAVEYRVYRQLCWAKHANPVFQAQFGHRMDGDEIVSFNGPDTSAPAVKAAWFALEHAIGLASMALRIFAVHHLPSITHASILPLIDSLGAGRKMLEATAKSRWGTQDPFPGQWRL